MRPQFELDFDAFLDLDLDILVERGLDILDANTSNETALALMNELETAFKAGRYGAPDRFFEQTLAELFSLLKSRIGGLTSQQRMENPTHLVTRLLGLMTDT